MNANTSFVILMLGMLAFACFVLTKATDQRDVDLDEKIKILRQDSIVTHTLLIQCNGGK